MLSPSDFLVFKTQVVNQFSQHFRYVINQKRHVMVMHKWSESKASGARSFMGGNKKRKLLSPSKRKTKPRVYKRRQCTFPGCFKEPWRLQNHLR